MLARRCQWNTWNRDVAYWFFLLCSHVPSRSLLESWIQACFSIEVIRINNRTSELHCCAGGILRWFARVPLIPEQWLRLWMQRDFRRNSFGRNFDVAKRISGKKVFESCKETDLVHPCLSLFSIFDSKSLCAKRKSQRCFVSACRFWNGWKCLSTPCNIVPVGLIVSGHRGHAYFAGKRFYFGCGGGTDACLMPFDSSLYLPMFHTPLRQLNHGSRFFFSLSLSLSSSWYWCFTMDFRGVLETDLEKIHGLKGYGECVSVAKVRTTQHLLGPWGIVLLRRAEQGLHRDGRGSHWRWPIKYSGDPTYHMATGEEPVWSQWRPDVFCLEVRQDLPVVESQIDAIKGCWNIRLGLSPRCIQKW